MKIRSASWIAGSMSVVKNKFLPRHSFTTSSNWGYQKHADRQNFGKIYEIHNYSSSDLRWYTELSLLQATLAINYYAFWWRPAHLVNGKLRRIPLLDPIFIAITNRYSYVWTFVRNHTACGSPNVASSNTTNFLNHHLELQFWNGMRKEYVKYAVSDYFLQV